MPRYHTKINQSQLWVLPLRSEMGNGYVKQSSSMTAQSEIWC
nr:MAG TPA: hypothetical protein [Bacteriophage sp.]